MAIQQHVHTLNCTAEPTAPIRINIGINSGLAAVGATCFERLTGARWTYMASGPVTNLAARLAELATHGGIYLGEETTLRVQHVFPLQELGKHLLLHIRPVILGIAVGEHHTPRLRRLRPLFEPGGMLMRLDNGATDDV